MYVEERGEEAVCCSKVGLRGPTNSILALPRRPICFGGCVRLARSPPVTINVDQEREDGVWIVSGCASLAGVNVTDDKIRRSRVLSLEGGEGC